MKKFKIDKDLNEEQIKAVTAIEGPALIIAGAGSGKTRVITYRIAYMLEKGIPQSAILALTFTNKAAREMETRIKMLTGKKLQSLTVSTFHAFGLKIIKEEAEILGYGKNFSVYDETDKISLIKESLRELRINSVKIDMYALSGYFSKIKTGLADWTEQGLMEPVYNEYNQALKIYNSVDFDDLLTIPLDLFEKNKEILAKYQKRYKYIMVDEFQDTSFIQYRLLKLLAGNKNSNCCVVGDDDQSIYSWRGANFQNILLFEKDFPSRIEIKLEQNYRSTSTILDAANGVISHNKDRKAKNLWSPQKGGKPVELFYPENEKDEGDFIANLILKLSITESYKYSDFGVLTRTNSLMRNIEEAFLAHNIPYRVSGGTSFFQRKEIKDIICYLRVVANSNDDISLLRIINTPRRGIGKTTISSLNEITKNNKISVWDAVSRLNYARSQGQQNLFNEKNIAQGHSTTELEEFLSLIEKFRSIFFINETEVNISGKKWSLSGCVRMLVDNIDYWSYLVIEHGKDEKKARYKYTNIEYFIKMIENWESDPDNYESGLYSWLNRISLITRNDDEHDNESKVNISTIHAAKGLEFPVVFIAGAEKGIIPHEKSIADFSDDDYESTHFQSVEEERRLFYVAITRAKEKLYITSCHQRRRMQNITDCQLSPFITEIPSELIQHHEKKTEIINEDQEDKYIEKMKALFMKK